MTESTQLAKQAGSTDPAVGLRAVRALRELADRLEAGHVEKARAQGWSWQDIATCIGISRQAVHKKYGHSPAGSPATDLSSRRRLLGKGR